MEDHVILRLQFAVLAVKANGLRICRGMHVRRLATGWDSVGDGVDPLGALLLHEQPLPGSRLTEVSEAAEALDVSVPWAFEFREGFYTWTACAINRFSPYRLGAWFAYEYADDLLDPLRL